MAKIAKNVLIKEEIDKRIENILINMEDIEHKTANTILNELGKEIRDITLGKCEVSKEYITIKYKLESIIRFKISITEILARREEQKRENNSKDLKTHQEKDEVKKDDIKELKKEDSYKERYNAMMTRIKEERDKYYQKISAEVAEKKEINQYIQNIERIVGYLDSDNKQNLRITLGSIFDCFKKRNSQKNNRSSGFHFEKILNDLASDLHEIENPRLEDRFFDFGPVKMIFLKGRELNKNHVYFCSDGYYQQIQTHCINNDINKLTIDNIQGIFEIVGEDPWKITYNQK